jgi:hypothetical protein
MRIDQYGTYLDWLAEVAIDETILPKAVIHVGRANVRSVHAV